MSWSVAAGAGIMRLVKLIDELRREHDLIDRLLGSLRTFASELANEKAPAGDGFAIVACLEAYAGGWHHEREEDILFAALGKVLPADRGPIAVVLADHRALEQCLLAMRAALAAGNALEFQQLAGSYTRLLWAHIDAENSVLFPESEVQLRRAGIRNLACPPQSAAIALIIRRAEELMERYPAGDAADVIRGEGCVMCPAYGDTCSGIEHEWWNEWEWEELDSHVAGA